MVGRPCCCCLTVCSELSCPSSSVIHPPSLKWVGRPVAPPSTARHAAMVPRSSGGERAMPPDTTTLPPPPSHRAAPPPPGEETAAAAMGMGLRHHLPTTQRMCSALPLPFRCCWPALAALAPRPLPLPAPTRRQGPSTALCGPFPPPQSTALRSTPDQAVASLHSLVPWRQVD